MVLCHGAWERGQWGVICTYIYICICIYPTMKRVLDMIQTSALPSILKKLTTTNNRHRLLIESHSLSMWVSPNDKPCIWGWLKYVEIPAMVIWIEDGANSIGWIQKNESRRKHPCEIPLKKSYEFPLIPYEILMKNPFLNPKNHFHISHTHTRIHRDS